MYLKPDLHINHRDCKDMFENMLLSCTDMAWSLHDCNDHEYWSFTRNICNRYVGSIKIPLRAWQQTCSAMNTTIWRPGFRNRKNADSSDPVVTCHKNCLLVRNVWDAIFTFVVKSARHPEIIRIRFLRQIGARRDKFKNLSKNEKGVEMALENSCIKIQWLCSGPNRNSKPSRN